jgi:hypothetical protein
MGELVGLGLRNLAHCPVELNLMPKSSLKVQQFSAKKPYLIATMACLVAILFAFGYFNDRIAKIKRESLEKLQPQLTQLQSMDARIKTEVKKLQVAQAEAVQLGEWLEDRSYWPTVMKDLRDVFLKTEREGKEQFKVDTGIWIERFVPDCVAGPGAPGAVPFEAAPAPMRGGRGGPGGFRGRGPGGFQPGGGRRGGRDGGAEAEMCTTINVLCRGVDLTSRVAADPAKANISFAFMLDRQLKASPAFLGTNSGIVGNLSPDDTSFGYKTFTVQVTVTPRRPFKL